MMGIKNHKRPSQHEYYMQIAMAVRERANCKRSKVGAVLVLEDRIIATGCNGTPEMMPICEDGGCIRCKNRPKSGGDDDKCICVHAEHNAILSAARFGNRVEGAAMYTTYQPCFDCAKALVQSHISTVFYLHEWTKAKKYKENYDLILGRLPKGHRKLDIKDPNKEWAHPGKVTEGAF